MQETNKFYIYSILCFLILSTSNSYSVNFIIYPFLLILFLCYGIYKRKSLVELYFLTYFFSLEILSELSFLNLINSIPILMMIIHLILIKGKSKLNLKKYKIIFLYTVLLLFISKFLSFIRFEFDIYSTINLFFLLIVIYFYSNTFTLNKYYSLLNTLVLISYFISVRVLIAFFNGENLLNIDSQNTVESAAIYNYIYKATFYISSYFFLIGIGLISSIYYFLQKKSLFYLIGIILTFSVMLLNANLSAIIGLLISLIYLLVILKKISFKLIVLSIIFTLILGSFLLSKLSYGDLIISRLSFEDFSSLTFRFSVFKNSLYMYFSDLIIFLFGIGSESTLRFSDYELIKNIKYNSISNKSEGAIDSNWLTFLIENGIFLFTIITALITISFLNKNNDSFSKLNSSLVLFFTITGFTQIFVYAKVGSIFYLLLVSTFLIKYNYDYSRRCK
tara:strand:+ start:75 stop:1418 length:1344 start_codon:yes stop_codon:yes gene_type:complete